LRVKVPNTYEKGNFIIYLYLYNIMNQSHFISVDWGTSNFRMRLVDNADLSVVSEVESDQGAKPLYLKWTEQNEPREKFFLDFLREKISTLGEQVGVNTPIIISGMASSTIGMRSLPYAQLPFSCSGKDLHVENIQHSSIQQPVYLVSGVAAEDDVIRGEETQLIGLHNFNPDQKSFLYILPGTHSKHVYVKDHNVVGYDTFMTGEMFEVISKYTILRDSIKSSPLTDAHREAFVLGIQSEPSQLLKHLFKIRAKDILSKTSKEENFFFLSGLLIGQELSSIATDEFDEIILAAQGTLATMYLLGTKSLNIKCSVVDHDSIQNAVVRGHSRILKSINKRNTHA